MNTEDFSTFTGITISICGVIGSFFTMAAEKRKQNELQEKSEKRIEYKLRIYELLIDDILSFDDIVSKFNASSPFKPVDQIELRKCLYEMLTEETVIVFDDRTYTSNTSTIQEDNDEI